MKLFGYEMEDRKLAFLLIFSALALFLSQFNFSQILGVEPSKSFTMFQFLGPIAGGILGPVGGVVSILLVSISNFLLTGEVLSLPVVVSFLTMACAAIYFGSKRQAVALIAVGCTLLFWIHPIGSEVRLYTLFWVIPIVASFVKNNIFLRSLGATFTAHAVGSVAYLYAFNIPAEVWVSLPPVVIVERFAFAVGITVSYYVISTLLHAFASRMDLSAITIEKKYALLKA